MNAPPNKETSAERRLRRMYSLCMALVERLDRAGLLNPQEQHAATELRIAFNASRHGSVELRRVTERIRDLQRLVKT